MDGVHNGSQEHVIEISQEGYAVVDVRSKVVTVDEGQDVGYAAFDPIRTADVALFVEGVPFGSLVPVLWLAKNV